MQQPDPNLKTPKKYLEEKSRIRAELESDKETMKKI